MLINMFFEYFRDCRKYRNRPVISRNWFRTTFMNWIYFGQLQLVGESTCFDAFVYNGGYWRCQNGKDLVICLCFDILQPIFLEKQTGKWSLITYDGTRHSVISSGLVVYTWSIIINEDMVIRVGLFINCLRSNNCTKYNHLVLEQHW